MGWVPKEFLYFRNSNWIKKTVTAYIRVPELLIYQLRTFLKAEDFKNIHKIIIAINQPIMRFNWHEIIRKYPVNKLQPSWRVIASTLESRGKLFVINGQWGKVESFDESYKGCVTELNPRIFYSTKLSYRKIYHLSAVTQDSYMTI